MTVHGPSWRVARFGAFEVHRESGELRKRGLRIKVQEQPFRILVVLLERRGEIVTREELQQILWPEGTFVDFEHSLNAAIGKLRQALSDSAETPRFIETLARRGYRFTGSVEIFDPQTSVLTNVSPEAPEYLLPEAGGEIVSVLPRAAESQKPTPRRVAASILGLGGAAALVAVWWWSSATMKTGGLPVRLTSYSGAESRPAFSPDGTLVAFVWDGPEENNGDIYVKVVGSGEPVRLTFDPAFDDAPAWSPDGRWIAFVRRNATEAWGDVLVVPALGGVERKVGQTVFSSQFYGPTLVWTSDSKWLATRDDSRSIPGLYLISVETREVQLLVEWPGKHMGDRGAAFSADGTRLAFCRSGNLYVIELDGLKPKGAPRQLTRDPRPVAVSPAWSPNQQDIVFQRGMSVGTARLWRVRADGTGDPSPIPNIGISAFHPTVSRSGRLAYAERIHDPNIWRLPLRGAGVSAGPPIRLIASSQLDSAMAFSPNGRQITFVSSRTGVDQIWAADSDGSRPVQLTHYLEGVVGSPRWSPDSGLIAYDAVLNGHKDIYIMPAGGGPSTRFTNTGENWVPSWSADGKWIYFSSDTDGGRDVWKKSFSGRGEARVTHHGGVAARESPDGKFFSYGSSLDGSLWLMPMKAGVPDEGQKRLVAKRANVISFDMSNSGIYYDVWVSFGEQTDRKGPQIEALYFYDYLTGRTRTITTIAKPLSIGLSVSRDERWLLFSQVDRAGSDLMLMDGFP